MVEQIEMPDEFTAPRGTGAQLRLAREKLGLTIKQLADRTRIPQRHIETIEAGNFSALPGRAYAVGFVRTLSRETGLDADAMVAQLRDELDTFGGDFRDRRETYQPGDPSRAPSRTLVWVSVVATGVLLAGLYMAARLLFSPAADLPSLVGDEPPVTATPTPASPAVDPSGPVTFTAQGTVWVRFTNADGTRLMEGELAEGQTFTVPPDAVGPRLLTGRPDLLTVAIGGRAVAPISALPETVQNVPVDAASLLARAAPAASAVGAGPATSAATAAATPARQPAARRPSASVTTTPEPAAAPEVSEPQAAAPVAEEPAPAAQ